MKSFFSFFILGFFLLILESTLFSSVFFKVFDLVGLDSISYFTVDTALILCLYVGITRRFKDAVLIAFSLGYLKDLLVLSGAWINPFIFVLCAIIANILKRVMLIKGMFTFVIFTFCMSMIYCILWMMLTYNIFSLDNAFSIGGYALLPNAAINALFSWILYAFFVWFDKVTNLLEEEQEGKLTGRL